MQVYLIKKPVVTEKSLYLAKTENKYVFEVARNANKDQIKAAIEDIFKVDVLAVNTIKSKRKTKRTGKKRKQVIIPSTKKAVVHLKKDQSIDLFDFDKSEK